MPLNKSGHIKHSYYHRHVALLSVTSRRRGLSMLRQAVNILTGHGRPTRGVPSPSWFYGGPTTSDRKVNNISRDTSPRTRRNSFERQKLRIVANDGLLYS